VKTDNLQTTHPPAVIRGWVRGISAATIADVAALQWVVMTPAQLTANTDNWNPVDATDSSITVDTAAIIRASTDASRNLTGLTAPNPADEKLIVLENIGAQDLVLITQAGSTAANQFICPDDANLTLSPDSSAYLLYDSISARWRVTSGGSGGSGGDFLTRTTEDHLLQTIVDSGAAVTLDCSLYGFFDITLTANCTITISNPPVSGVGGLIIVILRQGGSGSYTVTWPASVKWQSATGTNSGSAPTLWTAVGAEDVVQLATLDGGTTWGGEVVSRSPSAGSVISVAMTVPAEFSVSGSPITSSGTLAITKANETANTVWAGPTSGATAAPTFRALVAADIPAGAGTTDHVHVMDYLVNGDGSTAAFELPAAPYDAYSVAAYVAGTLTEVTLSGTMLTTATFGSAPASGTNNVRFDIVAAIL
jgi:hypothetical protein